MKTYIFIGELRAESLSDAIEQLEEIETDFGFEYDHIKEVQE